MKLKQSFEQIFEFCVKNDSADIDQYKAIKAIIDDLSIDIIFDMNESFLKRYKNPSEIIEGPANLRFISNESFIAHLKMLFVYTLAKNSVEFLDFDLDFNSDSLAAPNKWKKSKTELKRIFEEKSVQIKLNLLKRLNYYNNLTNGKLMSILDGSENEIEKLLAKKFDKRRGEISSPKSTDRNQKAYNEQLMRHSAEFNRKKTIKTWQTNALKSVKKVHDHKMSMSPKSGKKSKQKANRVDENSFVSRNFFDRANVQVMAKSEGHTQDSNHKITQNEQPKESNEREGNFDKSKKLEKAPEIATASSKSEPNTELKSNTVLVREETISEITKNNVGKNDSPKQRDVNLHLVNKVQSKNSPAGSGEGLLIISTIK